MDKLGQKIRKRRQELNLKVYELATKVGVNPVYITQIEKHNKLPSLPVITNIQNVLGITGLTEFYLRKKFPDLHKMFIHSGSQFIPQSPTEFKNIKENAPKLLLQERLFYYIHGDATKATHKAFAINLLSQHAPSKVNDEKTINGIIKYLKKAWEDKKEFWTRYKKQEKKLLKSLSDSK